MALNKTGLAYYKMDTDRYQDIRIKKLKKDFGPSGIAIYDYIVCEVYRVKGCFLVWDDSTVFDVADYFNVKESLIQEVVTYCGVVGLFNKALLEHGKIITSQSIQNRYSDACTVMKRKSIEIPEVAKILPEELIKIPEEPAIPPEEIDKVKNSTVNKSKVNKSKVNNKAKAFGAPDGDAVKKSDYDAFLKIHENDERPVLWAALKEFIKDKQPGFINPYMDLWNLFALHYKLIKEPSSITDKRRKKFNVRIAENQFDFLKILERISSSAFLKGNNKESWKVSIEFILDSEENYIKILEGKYDR